MRAEGPRIAECTGEYIESIERERIMMFVGEITAPGSDLTTVAFGAKV